MSFGLPWMLAAGVVAALGVVALHLLSTRRPPTAPLPTARFVPASDLRAVSRTSRPTDLLLLALRALAVLLIGAAFARPLPDAPGPAVRRVVALEWTTALRDTAAARAAARAALGDGDALVLFDTAARVLPREAIDALPAPSVRGVALSPMLVALRDGAASIARGADSIAVTVVSGFPAEAWDDATAGLRAAWDGRIEPVPVLTVVDTVRAARITVQPADPDDPLVAAVDVLQDPASRGEAQARDETQRLAPSSVFAPASEVRILRVAVTAEDSLWLNRTPGAVLLAWPRDSSAVHEADGVFASLGGKAALVAPLARRGIPDGRVIARWRDGAPAATERPVGSGCVREVGITVPERGDVTLRGPFLQLLQVLAEPCGGRRSPTLSDSALASFADDGALVAAGPLVPEAQSSPWMAMLLAAALVLLLTEQWVRRRA